MIDRFTWHLFLTLIPNRKVVTFLPTIAQSSLPAAPLCLMLMHPALISHCCKQEAYLLTRYSARAKFLRYWHSKYSYTKRVKYFVPSEESTKRMSGTNGALLQSHTDEYVWRVNNVAFRKPFSIFLSGIRELHFLWNFGLQEYKMEYRGLTTITTTTDVYLLN